MVTAEKRLGKWDLPGYDDVQLKKKAKTGVKSLA